MAAIANGIHKATGSRLQSLPMAPGKILDAMLEQGNGGAGTGD
jgi:CO/xanthine dehydrogenase Mo-binding subunit